MPHTSEGMVRTGNWALGQIVNRPFQVILHFQVKQKKFLECV